MAQQPPQSLQPLSNLVDSALFEVRVVRDTIVKAHQKINAATNGEVEVTEAYWKVLTERVSQAYKYYGDLEMHAKSLSTFVSSAQIERLHRFLNEAHLDPHIKELYEKALEVSAWIDTSAQFLHFYVALFRRFLISQRRLSIVDRPLLFSSSSCSPSPQILFDQLFPQAVTELSNQKPLVTYRYLEKSTLNAVIELKFGRYAEKIAVYHQKMLIVVNNGVIESLLIIAPHEDWSYLDESRKIVDILKESRFVVYQKLTVQAHITLMQTIHNVMDPQALSSRNLIYVLSLLSRFQEAMNLKCKVCNRILKNSLPPTIFDIRSSIMQALHESCR